jgi:hypothetical protein
MAAVTDRVDGGRQLHEGACLREGEHPSGHDGVVPTPTTGAVVLQHPFVDGIFYRGTGVQQVRVSAVVRLRATARGLLARRRLREMQKIEQVAAVRLKAVARGLLARQWLQKMRRQMRNREAALAAVAFDAQGRDLDPLADPLLYPRVCMVFFLRMAYSNSAGVSVEVSSSLSSTGTRCLAPQLSVSDHREDVSVGLRRDCLQVVVPLRPSHSDGLHGIQVVDGAYRQGVTQ